MRTRTLGLIGIAVSVVLVGHLLAAEKNSPDKIQGELIAIKVLSSPGLGEPPFGKSHKVELQQFLSFVNRDLNGVTPKLPVEELCRLLKSYSFISEVNICYLDNISSLAQSNKLPSDKDEHTMISLVKKKTIEPPAKGGSASLKINDQGMAILSFDIPIANDIATKFSASGEFNLNKLEKNQMAFIAEDLHDVIGDSLFSSGDDEDETKHESRQLLVFFRKN